MSLCPLDCTAGVTTSHSPRATAASCARGTHSQRHHPLQRQLPRPPRLSPQGPGLLPPRRWTTAVQPPHGATPATAPTAARAQRRRLLPCGTARRYCCPASSTSTTSAGRGCTGRRWRWRLPLRLPGDTCTAWPITRCAQVWLECEKVWECQSTNLKAQGKNAAAATLYASYCCCYCHHVYRCHFSHSRNPSSAPTHTVHTPHTLRRSASTPATSSAASAAWRNAYRS